MFLGLCFGLFGGVVCPLVWCGVSVLLWECFVGWVSFVVWCVLGSLEAQGLEFVFIVLMCVWCVGCVFGHVFWDPVWGSSLSPFSGRIYPSIWANSWAQ